MKTYFIIQCRLSGQMKGMPGRPTGRPYDVANDTDTAMHLHGALQLV